MHALRMKGLLVVPIVVAVMAVGVSAGCVTSPWEMAADMTDVRGGLAGAAGAGFVFAIGGTTPTGAAGNRVERYDPVADNWEVVSSMPTARHSLGCAELDGWIYAIGGHVGNSRRENERYDPVNDRWDDEERADMPTARSGAGVAAARGKIYVFGGNRYGSQQSIIEAYDPASDSWEPRGHMPQPLEPTTAASMAGKIYLAGGYSPDGQATDYFWCYDPASGEWDTSLPRLNVARVGHELVAVGDTLFAIGGCGISSVECWKLGDSEWTLCEPLNTPRCAPGAAVLGSRIYIFGGTGDDGYLRSTEYADVPDGGQGIEGCVSVDGVPLPNAKVTLKLKGAGKETTRTDENGVYLFEDVDTSEKGKIIIKLPGR